MNARFLSALSASLLALAGTHALAADSDAIKSREVIHADTPFWNLGSGLPEANVKYTRTVRSSGAIAEFGRAGVGLSGSKPVRAEALAVERAGRESPAAAVNVSPLAEPRKTGLLPQRLLPQRFGRA